MAMKAKKPAKPAADSAKSPPIQRARKPMGPKSADWRPAFLAALGITGMHGRAAEAAGIDPGTAWRERQNNAEFAAAVKATEDQATVLLEDAAIQRAVHGMKRFQFSKSGEPLLHPETGEPYYEHDYSDTLLSKLLTGRIPERYRDKVEHSGKVENVHMTLEEIETRMKEAKA